MFMLTRDKIKIILTEMNEAFNAHDLEGVLNTIHEGIYFENWTGARVKGREKLRLAWTPWFEDHGGFRFTREDTFIDEDQQKALTRWRLDWPSVEKGHEGKHETRLGVDVIRFEDGKIIEKLTYSKTTIEIEGRRIRLRAPEE
ncbi:nuclear transport factor 2 family protein [Candidatus Bathyarchaeota archaeon]|nr:MAG: nuclear transport factor 2 family protein [Candidatus Bathyarchaeota archaeon]